MRDDYLKEALKKIDDPNILVNVVSRRVKQFRAGVRPLVESLEKLSAEDTALREIMEDKITYELGADEVPSALDLRSASARNVRTMAVDPVERKSVRAVKPAGAEPAAAIGVA